MRKIVAKIFKNYTHTWPAAMVPLVELIRSFSNDDDDGSENVTIKMNSRFLNDAVVIPTSFWCQM